MSEERRVAEATQRRRAAEKCAHAARLTGVGSKSKSKIKRPLTESALSRLQRDDKLCFFSRHTRPQSLENASETPLADDDMPGVPVERRVGIESPIGTGVEVHDATSTGGEGLEELFQNAYEEIGMGEVSVGADGDGETAHFSDELGFGDEETTVEGDSEVELSLARAGFNHVGTRPAAAVAAAAAR